jgi:preprotein translocase subunit SecE
MTVAKEGKKTMAQKIDGLKSEFKKISFLDKETVRKQTTAVVIASIVLAVVIAVIDMIFKHGVDILVNL